MIEFLYDHDEDVARFVATLVPHCARGFAKCKTIGILAADGRLIGGLVYHNYDPEAEIMEISGAATDPRWLTRPTLRRMFEYPFIECGCQLVVMRVPVTNERLLRQLAAYNFSFTLLPRLFGRELDGVIATLTDDAWLANKFSTQFYRHLRKEAA
jgi:RimJ/RimL family protein N-acetyltransferase